MAGHASVHHPLLFELQSTDRGSPQSFLLTKDEAVEGLNQLIVKRSILYRTRKAIADWDIIQKLLEVHRLSRNWMCFSVLFISEDLRSIPKNICFLGSGTKDLQSSSPSAGSN